MGRKVSKRRFPYARVISAVVESAGIYTASLVGTAILIVLRLVSPLPAFSARTLLTSGRIFSDWLPTWPLGSLQSSRVSRQRYSSTCSISKLRIRTKSHRELGGTFPQPPMLKAPLLIGDSLPLDESHGRTMKTLKNYGYRGFFPSTRMIDSPLPLTSNQTVFLLGLFMVVRTVFYRGLLVGEGARSGVRLEACRCYVIHGYPKLG